jgi:hypothetical protein
MNRILALTAAFSLFSIIAFTQTGLTHPVALPTPTLDETSGIVYTNGDLWTHNDSGNPPAIYKIDPSAGAILQTVNVTNATNVDWEDITADDDYIYIGDFGNNGNGIRTNLRVYKVTKSDIPAGANVNVTAAVINFSYSDQVIGTSPGSNSTEFDCEAFFVKDNLLHLFTKDWVNHHTKHYTLSTAPGTYSISSPEPFFDVNGLVTSADISDDGQVALVGYQPDFSGIFMYVLDHFSGGKFFNGNSQHVALGSVIDLNNVANSKGQMEAVTFTTGGDGYVTNEKIASVPARMYQFSLSDLVALPVHLLNFTVARADDGVHLAWQTQSETNTDYFSIERSSDGIHFLEIARKPTAGSAGSVISYEYVDGEPLEGGNNYYRLIGIDKDRKKNVFDIKSAFVKDKLRLSTYFVGSTLMVKIHQNKSSQLFYRIINMNGAVVKMDHVRAAVQSVDVASLVNGEYVFALSNGSAARFQKK